MSIGLEIGNPFAASEANAAGKARDAAIVVDALRQAPARDELRLLYQSVIDVVTDRIVGAEALLRGKHPDWSALSPQRFLAIAEAASLMNDIGDWTMRQACRDLQAWDAVGGDGLRTDLLDDAEECRIATLFDSVSKLYAE